jgi:hypothetical protein
MCPRGTDMLAVAVQLPAASSVSRKAVAGGMGIDPIAAEKTSAKTNDNLRIFIHPLRRVEQRPVGIVLAEQHGNVTDRATRI